MAHILIAGGIMDGQRTSSSYTMKIRFQDHTHFEIRNVKYELAPEYLNSFRGAAFGNFQGMSVIMGGIGSVGQCNAICQGQNNTHVITPLNVNRYMAAATLIDNKLVIAGGRSDEYDILDSIEILDLDELRYYQESKWLLSDYLELPTKVLGHTLVMRNNKNINNYKLYVIGGLYESSGSSDKVWEGNTDCKVSRIIWKEMEFRLQRRRHSHFSFVISNKIIIFGGCDDDVMEIIEDGRLIQGSRIPFKLDTECDQAVLYQNHCIIITSRDYGLIIYNHIKGTMKGYPNYKLKEDRQHYAAILQ